MDTSLNKAPVTYLYHDRLSSRCVPTRTDGKIIPEKTGTIEVPNRFWGALAHSAKVAAVLAGDEHEYHRLRVDRHTPVGS